MKRELTQDSKRGFDQDSKRIFKYGMLNCYYDYDREGMSCDYDGRRDSNHHAYKRGLWNDVKMFFGGDDETGYYKYMNDPRRYG